MARTRITLREPERFKDPANLSWERYIALQARERERYLAERATIPAPALEYKTVGPRYLERGQRPLRRAQEVLPVPARGRAARRDAERAGIPQREWLPAWEQPGTTCRFFRHVLELEDPIEILVKANFVAEGAAGPGTFTVLADGAEARGDLLSAVNHRARIRDETRHISYARALVKALIEDDPGNLTVIQEWQDESLQLFSEVAKGGARQEWWQGFLDSYYKISLPLGLRATPLSI